jgi:hypothetical protein
MNIVVFGVGHNHEPLWVASAVVQSVRLIYGDAAHPPAPSDGPIKSHARRVNIRQLMMLRESASQGFQHRFRCLAALA